jgi:glycosyltransferase involved in cell wall biosynthesis
LKKPKLLVVSPIPPPMSGPEIMTRHLLNSKLGDSYELIHYNISKGREVADKANFDLVNVSYGLIQPLKLFWLLLRHRPDAVYTNLAQNNGGFLRYASFYFICALFRRKVVARVMGDGFGHFYQRSKYKGVIRFFCGMPKRFIVRAELLKKQFEGVIPYEKLKVVYSGIAVSDFDRPDLEEPRAEGDPLRVLFVGYLTQAKGAFDLLKAIPQIVAEHPDVQFRFMGARLNVERNITYVADTGTPQEQVLDELASDPAIESHCEFLGVCSGDDKTREFLNADLMVFPSHSEAFPTVVLEAMAAGLPIVSTPVGVLPEAFDEENIAFVETGDVGQIRDTTLRFLRDAAAREKMGAHNHATARGNFALDHYAERVRGVLDDMIGRA